MTDHEHKTESIVTPPSVQKALGRSRLALGVATIALVAVGVLVLDRTIGPIQVTFGNSPAQAAPETAPLEGRQPDEGSDPIASQRTDERQSAVANPSDGIRVITHDGAAYAMDALSGTFFRFEGASMTPVEADPATLPAEAVAQLRSGRTQQPVVGDTTEQYNRAVELNEQIAEGNNAELKINALLARKDVAEKILTSLSKAAGIDIDGEEGMESAVYVFFDAQCPYCHKLYQDMRGKVDSKWLPTLSLGPGGIPLIRHIMGDGGIEIVKDAEGHADSVIVKADDQRDERLRQVVGDGWREATGELTSEIDFITRENETLLRFLFGQQENLIGVPAIIVALPDGTARMLRGYEPSTVAQILELQGRVRD